VYLEICGFVLPLTTFEVNKFLEIAGVLAKTSTSLKLTTISNIIYAGES
jgi:hypothetical protein